MTRRLLLGNFTGIQHRLHDGVVAGQPLHLTVSVQVGATVTEMRDHRARVDDHRGDEGGAGAGEPGVGEAARMQVAAHLHHRAAQPRGHLPITDLYPGEVANHVGRQQLNDQLSGHISMAGAAHPVGDYVEPLGRVRSPPVVVAGPLTPNVTEPGIGCREHGYIASRGAYARPVALR